MHRDPRAGPRHARTVHDLTTLLEDALSAVAGWTVVPPDIYPIEASLGGPNWSVDHRLLDNSMLEAVRNLQDRYELVTKRPRSFQTLLRFLAACWSSRRPLLRAEAFHSC